MTSSTDAVPAVVVDLPTFLTGTAMFFVLKLTTSVDDVLWLSPFLAMADGDVAYKLHCGLLYTSICILVTMEALLIKVAATYGFDALLHVLTPKEDGNDRIGADEEDSEAYWTAPRLLCIVASICIAGFALKEWRDWKEEKDSDDNSCSSGGGEGKNKIIESGSSGDDEVPTIETSQQTNSRRSSYSSDGEYESLVAAARKNDSPLDDEEAQRLVAQDEGIVGISMNSLPPHVQIRQGSEYESLPSVDTSTNCNGGRKTEILHNESEETEEKCKISEETPVNQKHTLWTLLVVAFFGTLDDLALFSAVLMGRSIQYPSLLCGSILAALFIVLVSWGVSMIKPFEQAIHRIPLWALLFGISLYILVDGLLG